MSRYLSLPRRIPAAFLVTLASVGALGYFLYHAENGKYGVQASYDVAATVAALENRLSGLRERQERLERMVVLLRDDSVDPDMLDEQARINLGYSHERELIILTPR